MPKYLVLYHSPMSAREQMTATPEETQKGMELWMAWAGRAGDAIVDFGVPLESRTGSDVAGYSILQADSQADLDAILDGHPHAGVPGNSIETLEFLALPGS